MKYLFIVFLTLVTLKTKAQDSTKVNLYRWQAGIFFSPSITAPNQKSQPYYVYKPGLGYNTGVFISYKLNKYLSLQLSLLLSQKKFNYTELYYTTTLKGDYISYSSVPVYKFIEVPLKLNYKFIQHEKISVYATIGVTGNVFIRGIEHNRLFNNSTNETYSSSDIKNTVKKDFFKKENLEFGALVGLGANYKINNKIEISIQPEYRNYYVYKFNKTYKSSFFKSLGVNCCIGFNF